MTDTGFINFPFNKPHISYNENGKTYCYIVSLDVKDDKSLPFLDLNIDLSSYTDDISPKKSIDTGKMSLTDAIEAIKSLDPIDIDLNIISAVLVGSTDHIFSKSFDIEPWSCSFTDLTTSGRDLYYSLKKLHYDKEIKIITITKI